MVLVSLILIAITSVVIYLLTHRVVKPHYHNRDNRCHCGDHGESLGLNGHHFDNCPEYGLLKNK